MKECNYSTSCLNEVLEWTLIPGRISSSENGLQPWPCSIFLDCKLAIFKKQRFFYEIGMHANSLSSAFYVVSIFELLFSTCSSCHYCFNFLFHSELSQLIPFLCLLVFSNFAYQLFQ